jgi:hypothetical protein
MFPHCAYKLFTHRLYRKNCKKKPKACTDNQAAKDAERAKSLVQALHNWFDVAKVFIPGAQAMEDSYQASRTRKAAPGSTLDVRLWLPSKLPPEARKLCLGGVVEIEKWYRIAQGVTAVAALRTNRCLRALLWDKFKHNIAGKGNTYQLRTKSPIYRVEELIKSAVSTYHLAWNALQALNPGGAWLTDYALYKLEQEDNRGPTPHADKVEREIERNQAIAHAARNEQNPATEDVSAALEQNATAISKGRYVPPWIFTARPRILAGTSNLEEAHEQEYIDQVRSEWCNAQARAEQWDKEVELLPMEMYRTLLALCTRYQTWQARSTIDNKDAAVADGLCAYAHKQMDNVHMVRHYFVALWTPVLTAFGRALPVWWADALDWLGSADDRLLDPEADQWMDVTSSEDTVPPPPRPTLASLASDAAAASWSFNQRAALVAKDIRIPPTIQRNKRKHHRLVELDKLPCVVVGHIFWSGTLEYYTDGMQASSTPSTSDGLIVNPTSSLPPPAVPINEVLPPSVDDTDLANLDVASDKGNNKEEGLNGLDLDEEL